MKRQLLHRDLWSITLANSQNNFGSTLVGVFVPLFLIGIGLTIRQVALFYLVYAAAKLLVNLPVIRLINHYGERFGLILARLANCAFLLGLALAGASLPHWYIWLLPLCMALANAFQWSSEHLHLARVTSADRLGTDLARIGTIAMLITAVAPAIGSLLDDSIGRSGLLVIAFAIVLTSMFWLRSINHLAGGHQRVAHISYNLRHAPWRDVVANFAFNFHIATGTMVWPVYLAIILHDTGQIGFVTAAGTLIAAVVLLIAGKRTDIQGTSTVLREGSIATAIVHASRAFGTSLASVTGLNVVWSTVSKYQANAWTTTYYEHTRAKGINYIMSMEIAGDLACIALWALVYSVLSLWTGRQGFIVIFVVSAVISLGCLLITPPPKTKPGIAV